MRSKVFIQAVAVGLGLMLSPELLLALGNAAGGGGAIFLKAMVLAALVYLALSAVYGRMIEAGETESSYLKRHLGPVMAVGIPFAGRSFLAVCLGTTVVVTAGFTFNETFLYWFPNFAFAAGVLVLALVLNLIGPRVALWAQVAFAGTALAGLVCLGMAGLMTAGGGEGAWGFSNMLSGFSVDMFLPAALVFLGAEMAGFVHGAEAGERINGMRTAIVTGGVVLLMWALASMLHVPLEKLAGTSIPYSKAARAIWGQPGRIVIGVVIIAGAAGAVNALMLTMARMFRDMVNAEVAPRFLGVLGGRIAAVVLAGAIGGMMAGGMAGEPEILVFVRAGFVLWLLQYLVLGGAVLRQDRSVRSAWVSCIFILAATAGLVLYEPERALLLWSVAGVFIGALVVGAVFRGFMRTAPPSTIP